MDEIVKAIVPENAVLSLLDFKEQEDLTKEFEMSDEDLDSLLTLGLVRQVGHDEYAPTEFGQWVAAVMKGEDYPLPLNDKSILLH